MIKNYLIVGWRNLWKNKPVSVINIFGLLIGILSSLLIGQYVRFELSYDDFHDHRQFIYRVTSHYVAKESVRQSSLSTFNIGSALKSNFPEVEQFTRLHPYSRIQFSCALIYRDGKDRPKIFNESHLFYADPSFFSVFSFPLLQGDALTALKDPHAAVISEKTAEKYFGNEDPIGKVLTLKSSSYHADYVVTGVMKDIPKNSHLKPEILLSIKSLQGFENEDGDMEAFYTYIRLSEAAHTEDLEKKLALFDQGRAGVSDDFVCFKIQALEDIHLNAGMQDEAEAAGSSDTIFFLVVLAFFIMILAWINYLNLTTARYLERIKEFGLRKISGANRYQLISQCLIETFLILTVSTVMALITRHLIFFIAPVQDYLFGNELMLVKDGAWQVIAIFFGLGIVFSLYQAYFLSSFRLTAVLKGRFSGTTKGSWLRKALVVFQFTIAVCLMIGIFTVYSQFKYMQGQDLGIDLGQKIVVKTPSNVDSTYIAKLASFKKELRNFANIRQVSISGMVPGLEHDWFAEVRKQNESKEAYKNLAVYVIDSDFFDMYDLKVVTGRGFLPEDHPGVRFGSKIENVIINEKAVKTLGFQSSEEAIDEIVFWGENQCRIIGVVKDFHQQSLRHPIRPAIFTVNNRDSIFYTIDLNIHNTTPSEAEAIIASALSLIRENWIRFFPDNPFDFFLLKDTFNDQYRPDLKLAQTLGLFSALATFIACLGLFGLSAYATTQRKREIGIRKVLGASATGIVKLISGDFLSLIVFAAVLAVPVAYFGIRHWLNYYAFAVDITWWFFAFPLILVVLIATITVCYHTIKASLHNPVDALKYE